MAHYAFLDENNIVTEVITGVDENELLEGLTPEEWYGKFRNQTCVRTSYHAKIRKHFAGIGFYYDKSKDAFIPPKPYPSWVLDEKDFEWYPPKPYPNDDKKYIWKEELLDWDEIA